MRQNLRRERTVFLLFLGASFVALMAALPIVTAQQTQATPKSEEIQKPSAAAGSSAPASPAPSTSESPSFEQADRNKDGFVDKSESGVVPGLSANFERADRSRDGKLDREEFAKGLQILQVRRYGEMSMLDLRLVKTADRRRDGAAARARGAVAARARPRAQPRGPVAAADRGRHGCGRAAVPRDRHSTRGRSGGGRDARIHRRARALPRHPRQGALPRRGFRALSASASGSSARCLSTSRVLQAAYYDCEKALLYWNGPYVLSQGDFAPWNIRAFGSQLFVFDWGSAHADASPLDDVLHYLMIQRRLKTVPLLRRAMSRAREFALAAYPEWSWRPPVIGALTLVYLLGVIVHREAQAQRPGGRRVLEASRKTLSLDEGELKKCRQPQPPRVTSTLPAACAAAAAREQEEGHAGDPKEAGEARAASREQVRVAVYRPGAAEAAKPAEARRESAQDRVPHAPALVGGMSARSGGLFVGAPGGGERHRHARRGARSLSRRPHRRDRHRPGRRAPRRPSAHSRARPRRPGRGPGAHARRCLPRAAEPVL